MARRKKKVTKAKTKKIGRGSGKSKGNSRAKSSKGKPVKRRLRPSSNRTTKRRLSKRSPSKRRSKTPSKKRSKKPSTKPSGSKGYVYNDPKGSDDALTAVDNVLTDFESAMAEEGIGLKVSSRPPHADGSVSGHAVLTDFEDFDDEDWKETLFRLSNFSGWPFAHGQTGEDRRNGAYWVSVVLRFNVPDGRKWRELEKRYERSRGAWETSTHWRHGRRANGAILDLASAGGGESVPSLLEQKKYGYKVESVTLKIVWTPDGRKPQWR